MEIMDIKIFDELLAEMEYYNTDLPVIPIDELLEDLKISKNK